MVQFPCFLVERTEPQKGRDAIEFVRLVCRGSGLLNPIGSYRNRDVKRKLGGRVSW